MMSAPRQVPDLFHSPYRAYVTHVGLPPAHTSLVQTQHSDSIISL